MNKERMHLATCWSEMMCVPCTQNELTLMTAERDGLGSQLLSVQQDCITARRQLAEAKVTLSDLPDHSDLDAAVFEANALRGQLVEAQGKLLAIKGRLLEIVEECEDIGEDPSYLFSMLDVIDPNILEPISSINIPAPEKNK